MLELQQRKNTLTSEVRRLRDDIENFYATRPYTRCIYTDPEPNFNRRSVHGVTCDLIKIANKANCTAIETAAGSMVHFLLFVFSIFILNNLFSFCSFTVSWWILIQ